LFGCACCRRIWNLLSRTASREAIEITEKWADGESTDEDRLDAARAAFHVPLETPEGAAANAAWWVAALKTANPLAVAAQAAEATSDRPNSSDERSSEAIAEGAIQANLARDIFGNPFGSLTIAPAWRTANVVGIAQRIYEERRFGD